MKNIDYTKEQLFQKGAPYKVPSLNLKDIDKVTQVKMTKVGNAITLTALVPDVPAEDTAGYFEQHYGRSCLRCGKDFSRISALRLGFRELCPKCEQILEQQVAHNGLVATITINGQTVRQVKSAKRVDSMLPYSLTKYKPVVGVKSLTAYIERAHDAYVSWVRKQGLTQYMNIVRKPRKRGTLTK